jgi:hypothetical protein
MSITSNSFPNHDPSIASIVQGLSVPATNSLTHDSMPEFVDRRAPGIDGGNSERRQFGSSHSDLSPDAKELAIAIDRYKIENRRRYITCEEMLAVFKTLGYRRDENHD